MSKDSLSNTIIADIDRIRHLEYLEKNEQHIINHAVEKYKEREREKTARKRKIKQTKVNEP